MSIASLPMYDLPELKAITDAWWHGLALAFRAEGIKNVPDTLWRGEDYQSSWTQPDLLLSQTCGYPLINVLQDKVALVATPLYGAPECKGSEYCSIVIVREDDPAQNVSELRGYRCVINSRTSQSGCNTLRALIAPLARGKPFFREVKVSGGHRQSATMVISGEADVAAIDCITYALFSHHCPHVLAGTRKLALTPYAPGLPYITRLDRSKDLSKRLKAGLEAACQDPTLSACRETLLIRQFSTLSMDDYQRIADMEREATKFGYTDLS
jgi:ABC-type phosphate/phosphonate transport system substrate-binding protein